MTFGNVVLSKNSMAGFVWKISSEGTTLWAIGTSKSANGVVVDASSNVFILQSMDSTWYNNIKKLSSSGATLWEGVDIYGSGSETRLKGISTDSTGNVVVAGYFGGTLTFGGIVKSAESSWCSTFNSGYGGVVWKLSSEGTTLWVNALQVSCNYRNYLSDVVVDNANGIVVTGRYDRLDSGTVRYARVWKLSSTGTLLWWTARTDHYAYTTFVPRLRVHSDSILSLYPKYAESVVWKLSTLGTTHYATGVSGQVSFALDDLGDAAAIGNGATVIKVSRLVSYVFFFYTTI